MKFDFARTVRWGYAVGVVLIFIGLFSLAIVLAPLITPSKRPIPIRIPGQTNLTLNLAGGYMGIVALKKNMPRGVHKIFDIDFVITDEQEEIYFDLQKLSPYMAGRTVSKGSIPLFQFTVPEKGIYFLDAYYPYNKRGPTVDAMIIHESWNVFWRELVVGIAMFFLLIILAVVIMRKTYRALQSNAASR